VKKLLRNRKLPHILFTLLFAVFLCVGLRVYRDYGVPVDEYSQIELGRVNYERIVRNDKALYTNFDRYYGPAFETVAHAVTPLVQHITGDTVIHTRHLLVFLYWAVSLVVFYLFLGSLTGFVWLGLLGTVLLAVSPRQFAQGFYNSKDMVMLATGIFLLYSMVLAARLRHRTVLVHALLSGYALAVRPQAAVFIGASIAVFALASRSSLRRKVFVSLVYLLATAVAAFICYPVLWDAPLIHLSGIFARSMVPIGVPTRYLGGVYVSPDIPWHYLFVLVGVTSLVSVYTLALVGLFRFIATQGRRRWVYKKEPALYLALMFVVLGTFLAAILLHARVYDGWRHIYYIYPPLIAMAMYTLAHLGDIKTERIRRTVVVIAVGWCLWDGLSAAGFIIRNHPHEYVYFNALAGGTKQALSRFDGDYWGLSYTDLLSYLLTRPSEHARIYFDEPLPQTEILMIPPLVRHGYEISPRVDSADIIVSVHRGSRAMFPGFRKEYTVTADGGVLSGIYRRVQ